jgi:hypothetical protein
MKKKLLYFDVLAILVIACGAIVLGFSLGSDSLKTKIKSNQPIMVGEFLYRCGEQERLPTLK